VAAADRGEASQQGSCLLEPPWDREGWTQNRAGSRIGERDLVTVAGLGQDTWPATGTR
jgi:hypothetical protein